MEAYRKKGDLAAILAANTEVKKFITRKELGALLDPEKYIGTAPTQVDRVVARLSKYLDKKGDKEKLVRRIIRSTT
jgi:adenylosuccinate lyase